MRLLCCASLHAEQATYTSTLCCTARTRSKLHPPVSLPMLRSSARRASRIHEVAHQLCCTSLHAEQAADTSVRSSLAIVLLELRDSFFFLLGFQFSGWCPAYRVSTTTLADRRCTTSASNHTFASVCAPLRLVVGRNFVVISGGVLIAVGRDVSFVLLICRHQMRTSLRWMEFARRQIGTF